MSFDLSFQEVEELLEQIIHNKKLVQLDSSKGEVFVVFSFPAADDFIRGRHVRARALLEAQKEELPTHADMVAVIEERGIVTEADREKMQALRDKIEGQKRVRNLTKIEGRRKPIDENIERLSKELDELESKGSDLFLLTQEYRADEESLLFLTWASTYTIDYERYWDSFDTFEEETDLLLRTNALIQYTKFNRGMSNEIIRFLARHVIWRIPYSSALKIGGPLFPRGLHDLTTDQKTLLYWSNFYQSIYEMMPDDQPTDDVIEDDDKLDSYMEAYYKQRETERSGGRIKRGSGSSGKLSTSNSDEVIVTTNHPDYLSLGYTDKRVKSESASEVEVIAPNSRRARNRRAAKRNKRQ